MSKKMLPIKKPSIFCYLHHTYPLSIIMNYDDVSPWYFSNYLQLRCFRNIEKYKYNDFFNFYTTEMLELNPHLHTEKISKTLFSKCNTSITNFLIDSINNGYYVQLYLNHFYDTKMHYYKNFSMVHEILFRGYDLDEQCFYVYGFNEKDRLIEYKKNFDEVEIDFNNDSQYEWQQFINLLKYNPGGKFEFDIVLVTDILHDYLTSTNTTQNHGLYKNPFSLQNLESIDCAYGMEVYTLLLDLIRYIVDNKMNADYRPFHTLWEHKKCMKLRIQFLEENNYLDNSFNFSKKYEQVEKLSEILRFAILKYISTEYADIIKIEQLLNDMRTLEFAILGELYNHLRPEKQLKIEDGILV